MVVDPTRAPKGGGLGVILKCIFPSLPSTRPFGSSLASGYVGTPKLSEKKARALLRNPKLSEKKARALLGWVTHWEVAREFPKTKP
ncbi:hypothetical protein DVH24_014958 [Malus domestica]|uniref:Uncharacterized protein n=1 Tax=Malus domestica TaxID=3750 RepID=A0A498K0B9_MALDO|nr:hypothetical protein DVH24_014958 [Malus domestica]